jgi:ABC-type multidrug transport system permease subunit
MAEVEEEVVIETGAAEHKSEEKRYNPLWELTLARVREFVREPEALFWVFVFPVLLAFALGIAFRNTAPDKTPIAIESGSPAASAIASSLAESSELNVQLMTPEEAHNSLRTGRIALVLVAGEGSSDFEFRFDPTRPDSQIARLKVDTALQRALGRKDVAAVRDEVFSEPGARYIDFLIPGLIGLNLMGSGMWGLGFVVVQARTNKLLKRYAATPMRRSHFLLSFMFSRLGFLVFDVAAVIVFGWLVFDVAVHGSFLALAITSLIGGLAFSGIGLLVASRPKTIEGVSGLMNLVMVPMWVVSGTFFSSARFPDFLQPFIRALPLTALNDSLRLVMNEGAALASAWPQIATLAAWGLVSFAIALRIFRWQ